MLQRQQYAVVDLVSDVQSEPNSLGISPPGAGRRLARQPGKSGPRKTPAIFRSKLFYPPLAQSNRSVRCPRISSGEEQPRYPSTGPLCAISATLVMGASSKRTRETGEVIERYKFWGGSLPQAAASQTTNHNRSSASLREFLFRNGWWYSAAANAVGCINATKAHKVHSDYRAI